MKKLLLIILSILMLFSCSGDAENDTENNSNGNYIEFKLGNEIFKATNCTHGTFDDWNYYELENKKLKGVVGYDGFTIFIEDLNNDMYGDYVMGFRYSTPYITNTTLNTTCNNNVILFYNVTITRNDNIIGGVIEGFFSGKIGNASSIPCFDCCHNIYNFSGKFKVKIK
jgi:hypothetical protein